MEKEWLELIDYLEFQKEQYNAEIKMYQADEIGQRLWREHNVLIACCKAKWNHADLTISKIRRIKS